MAPLRRASLQFAERHPNIVVAAIFFYISVTFGGLLVGGVWGYQDSRTQRHEIERTADESHRALCSLRQDLHLRVESTKAFLEKHPDGIPGISRADLVTSIANQQRSIDALIFLHCR